MTKLPVLNTWKTAREKRAITISASQIEQKRRCARSWWFSRVRRLPMPPSAPQVFGTVLHAVAERYVRADDLGRGPDGEPMDLYPEGWHQATSRWDSKKIEGEIDLGQQALVKKLISKAIEEGVLERRPDRGVEREFRWTILGLEEAGTEVEVLGFIDLEHHGEVQDHKTTSNMRYAKSARALKESPQMLMYAKAHVEFLRAQGAPIPPRISLRHNYYCKDALKPKVRKVEVEVSLKEIEDHWETVIADANHMVQMRDTVEDGLSEIPDPEDSGACMAFGGCPYRTICGGRESVDSYVKRIDRYKAESYSDPRPQADRPAMFAKSPDPEDQTMDFATALAKKRAAQNGSSPSAPTLNPPDPDPHKETAPAATREASAPPAVTGAGPGISPPPWAFADCVACKGVGFNSAGNPCAICQHKSGVSAANYVITASGDGTVVWVNKKDDTDSGVSMLPDKFQAEVVTSKPKAPAAPPPPKEKEVKVSEPKEVKGVKPRAVATTTTTILCVNCMPSPNSSLATVSAHDVLHEIGKKLVAEVDKAESFYDINAFDRRDALRKAGDQIVSLVEGKIVVAEGVGSGESDLKALVDGLRPFVTLIINGA